MPAATRSAAAIVSALLVIVGVTPQALAQSAPAKVDGKPPAIK
ncbi:hypothetical protein [Bradyrhizobium sp. RT5a]|jgi:hypothetical protein